MTKESDIAADISELKTDIKWVVRFIKDCDKRYAKRWTEKLIWLMMAGVASWVLMQVLNLIQTAQAMFN